MESVVPIELRADVTDADLQLSVLYDLVFRTGSPADFRFYLPMVMDAASVLDVGCGTGALLHLARKAGHSGRLCGVDPANAMLYRARRHSDIEWVEATLPTRDVTGPFELAVMTGHVFQVFLSDAVAASVLDAVHGLLVPGGILAFESRNPLVRGWEGWTHTNGFEVQTAAGAKVRVEYEIDGPPVGDVVRFTTTFAIPSLRMTLQSRDRLRFRSATCINGLLEMSGFEVVGQYGDWQGCDYNPASPEIITVARARQTPRPARRTELVRR